MIRLQKIDIFNIVIWSFVAGLFTAGLCLSRPILHIEGRASAYASMQAREPERSRPVDAQQPEYVLVLGSSDERPASGPPGPTGPVGPVCPVGPGFRRNP